MSENTTETSFLSKNEKNEPTRAVGFEIPDVKFDSSDLPVSSIDLHAGESLEDLYSRLNDYFNAQKDSGNEGLVTVNYQGKEYTGRSRKIIEDQIERYVKKRDFVNSQRKS